MCRVRKGDFLRVKFFSSAFTSGDSLSSYLDFVFRRFAMKF